MPRSIELNNASAVFVREACEKLSSAESLSAEHILSLAGSLAGKASQFESLSVEKQHELVVSSLQKALNSPSFEDREKYFDLDEAKRYVEEALPTLLKGFEHAYREKKANSYWNRLKFELLEVWHKVTFSAFQDVKEPPKEVKKDCTTQEKKEEVVAAVVEQPQPQPQPQQQPQQEEKPLPSSQTATTNT